MKRDDTFEWHESPIDSLALDKLKVAVIGGTNGLGRAIALQLASRGAHVTVVGRSFKDGGVENISFVQADLSLMEVARKVAQQIAPETLDILLFTTGIFASTSKQVTTEGLERDLAVSYLNRLVMLKEIAPKMRRNENSLGFKPRIFLMGYPGSGELGTIDDLNQENSYGAIKAHMNTVAGNEALVRVAAERYPQLNIYGLNPGIVRTNIRDNLLGENSWKSYIIEGIIGWFTKTPEQYAAKMVPLMVAAELEKRSGTFYNNKAQAILPSEGMTPSYAASYVEASEELLKSKGLAK